MNILITANTAWNLAHFRRSLIEVLMAQSHTIIALAPEDESVKDLERLGCRFIPLAMNKKGVSPLQELKLLFRIWSVLRRERPDVVLSYTIKNNIYGALAARLLALPIVPNVTGLGTAFLGSGGLKELVKFLYRFAFRKAPVVFFQNHDDRESFLHSRLVSAGQARLVPGSGIDLDWFRPAPSPENGGRITFLLIARLIRDKGIVEFVEAARRVRQAYPTARFQLLGEIGLDNRTAIARAEVEQWIAEGIVDYLGTTTDVRPRIANADCVVLPSYREGTPRTLLEAAAMAKPIVATDVPGCRSVVDDGKTGFLCRARDHVDLSAKLVRMIELGSERREHMGHAAREKVEREFDQKIVIDAYVQVLASLEGRSGRTPGTV